MPSVPTLHPWLQAVADGPVIRHAGGAYTWHGWKAIFRRLAERVGVAASPYTIRHTVATALAKRRVPLLEIKAFMGHGMTTDIAGHYLHYTPDYLSGVIENARSTLA